MAKKYSGGITIPTPFKQLVNQPIVDYMVVEFVSDLDDIDILPGQFPGMLTYVEEDETLYVRKNIGWQSLEGIDQDNIDIFKVINIPEGAGKSEIATAINNLPSYTVNEKQSLWFTVIEAATFPAYPKTYKYKVKNLGKGTYGSGGTSISFNNLELVYVSSVTPTDVGEIPTTQTINFGEISGVTVSEYLNSQSPFVTIQNQNEGYTIFNTIESGIPRTYLWIGEGGDYGLGQLQSTLDDFQLLSDNAEVGNQDLQSVLENGSLASISEPLTITSNGFSLLGNAGGQITTNPSTGMIISGNAGAVTVNGNTSGVYINGNTGGVNLRGGSAGVIVTPEGGFKYSLDDSANYTDRSIPDVGYVNGLFNPQDLDSTLTNGNSSEIAISITDSISETRIDKSFLSLTNGNGVWSAQETGGVLVYSYNGTPKFAVDPDGKLTIANNDSFVGTFDPSNITENKTYMLPNNDGELALRELTVPLSGTETDKPMTGTIEFEDSDVSGEKGIKGSYVDNDFSILFTEEGSMKLKTDATTANSEIVIAGTGVATYMDSTLILNTSKTRGLLGGNDFTLSVQPLDYVQKKYVDNAISASAITLDATPTDSSTNGVQSGGVKSYVDGLVANTFRAAGNWDASLNTFPTTGTGTAGAIRRGDTYKVTVAGNPFGGAETLDVGDSFYATVPSPGQITSNWAKFEANTAQATASFRGTARLYNTTGTNTDGAIDQNTVTTQLATKKNNYTTETGIPYLNNGVETWINNSSAFYVRADGSVSLFATNVRSTNLAGYSEGAGTISASDTIATAINKLGALNNSILSASATLDFLSTAAGMSSDLTVAVTGAAIGDCVSIGVPSGSVNANSSFSGFVSSANIVTIRFNNYSAGAINPASGTFKVKVFK